MQRSLTLGFSLCLLSTGLFAQVCGPCSIDYGYVSPGVYPDTLPPATAGEYYAYDITFVMQADTTVDVVGTLDFLNYHIMEPVGLPYGMEVSTDLGDFPVDYDPDISLYGCARVCGTPLVPGFYEVTVPLIATLEFPGGDQAAEYSLFMEVLPAVPDGGGIIETTTFGCEPVTVGFETSVHSDGDDGFAYTWDFGNGYNSISEFPPDQTYYAVGGEVTQYIVTHTIMIDTIGFSLDYVTALSTGCDDCTIFGCTGLIDAEKPDLYIKIDDLGLNTLPGISNTYPPITWSLGIALDPAHTYTMQMKDEDGGGTGSDDNCGSFTFNGDDVGVSTLSSGGNEVEISITHPVISYVFYDTITVYPSVSVPEVAIEGLLTFCADDSTVLSADWSPGVEYQWYLDGNPIPEADSSAYVVYGSGSYMLQVTGEGGCTAFSDSIAIEVFENPDPPAIIVIGNTLSTSSTWDVQWYFNGSAIPGANATTYIPAIEGLYQVAATNGPCIAWSAEIDFAFQDIPAAWIKPLGIYPNPNTGIFSFSFDAEESEVRIRVLDIPGNTVYTAFLQKGSDGFQGVIDMHNLPAGVYVLQVQGASVFADEKIIIQ